MESAIVANRIMVLSAGFALLCSFLTQGRLSPQSGTCSEALAWILLPLLFQSTAQSRRGILPKDVQSAYSSKVAASSTLWVIAIGLAALCLCKTEKDLQHLTVRVPSSS